MLFRQHDAADYPEIAQLRWQLKSEDAGDLGKEHFANFAEQYARHLAHEDRRGDTVHWLSEIGGEVVAVMTVRIVRKEPAPDEPTDAWGYVTNCYVEPSHRNRGVGSQLLREVIAWARQRNLELLIVWPSDRSFPFYRRAGFTGVEAPLQLILNS